MLPAPVRPWSSLTEARLRAGGLIIASAGFAPGLRLERHSHELGSVSVILRGGYDSRLAAQDIHVTAGTAVITPPGEPHHNHFAGEPTQMLVVEFAPDTAWTAESFAHFLRRPGTRRDPRLRDLALRAVDELAAPDDVSALTCEGLALQLVASLGRLRPLRESTPPAWLRKVCERLHDNLERQASLAELAAIAGVERSRLLRAFRRHLQASPGEYLRRLRVERAAELLEASGDPVVEIAAATGFADQSHLTRVFRRVKGETPAAFRARRRRP